MSENEQVPTPELPSKITEEDRLRIENLYLKTQNMALQQQQLQADVVKAGELRQKLQQEMLRLKEELSTKYGKDLTKVQIQADGTIVDLPAPLAIPPVAPAN